MRLYETIVYKCFLLACDSLKITYASSILLYVHIYCAGFLIFTLTSLHSLY